MKLSPIPYDLVEVEWEDAETSSDWKTEADVAQMARDADDAELVRTVGYVVHSDEDRDIIAATAVFQVEDHRWHFSNFMQIPAGMIVTRKILRRAAKKAAK